MKKLIIILTTLLLISCGGVVTEADMAVCKRLCADHDGAVSVENNWFYGYINCYCDSAIIRIYK